MSSFPLFNLPKGAQKCVLRNMELFHQIVFSLVSKRSKEIVKSLNLKVENTIINISELVSMEVHNSSNPNISLFCDMIARNYTPLTEMYTPDFLDVQRGEIENGILEEYQWTKPGYEIEDWINHFLSILNHSKVGTIRFRGRNPLDLEPLRKIISDITEILIGDGYSSEYIQQICQAFPSAKQLSLSIDTLQNLVDCHTIFCRNFDILSLDSRDPDGLAKCQLDDLLVMNSRSIRIDSDVTEKDFNQFLKNWINGSNPRMEHIGVHFADEIDAIQEIILNGLEYHTFPYEHERIFENVIASRTGSRTRIIDGGFDIQRNDGTIATIIFHEDDRMYDMFDVEVFVWN